MKSPHTVIVSVRQSFTTALRDFRKQLYRELRLEEPTLYRNFMRTALVQLDQLLSLVWPLIEDTVMLIFRVVIIANVVEIVLFTSYFIKLSSDYFLVENDNFLVKSNQFLVLNGLLKLYERC